MRRSTALIVLALLVTGCSPPVGSAPRVERALPTPATPPLVTVDRPVPAGVAAALEPANGCDALLDYFIDQALDQVGPYGLDGSSGRWMADESVMAAETVAGDAGGQPTVQPSSTNVQVEGVDEGDFVKADGDVLYLLSSGHLRVFDTSDGDLDELAALETPEMWDASQMLVEGDRLVIVGPAVSDRYRPAEASMDIAPVVSNVTGVTLVDVTDPSSPEIIESLTVDGWPVTTRLVGGHLRLVLEAHPVGLEWSFPEGSGLRAEREATESNRDVIRRSTIENWLPWYVAESGDEGVLLDCRDVWLPPEPSGVSTVSILDFDLAGEVGDWDAASVVATGSTVYANTERTYVATQRWIDPFSVDSDAEWDGHKTRIHRFDTPVEGDLEYVASGDVDGFLLNQFAMDEHEDHLRVASTSAPSWWGGAADSVSQVTVLAADGNRLEEVGRVSGLGETETIQAVRFMGPVGYVVTFRQVDPLYVIDLADPTDPRAVGELKIPGFSNYLHPVADGLLLGVGQDADEETGQTEGLQISLFDVSDPTAPERIDTFRAKPREGSTESQLWSPVQGDHKAFTLAGERGYVPFEGWSWFESRGTEEVSFGVIEVDWSDRSLDGSRVLSLPAGKDDWWLSPQRVVVKGDVAYVVGHGGIAVLDLSSGDVIDEARF